MMFASIAALAIGLTGTAQEASPVTIVVVGVTVIDVEAGEARPGLTVAISGESIVKVAPSAGARETPGTRVVDGSGLFLMPGLIDAHVHWIDPETFGPLSVANGVVLVREMGNETAQSIDLRERSRRRDMSTPEMVVCGAIIDGDPPVWPFSKACKTADDGRAAVRELVDAGVDQLKVYSRLPRDAYFAILEEAKKHGKKAVGHVPESVTLEEAIAAGQASLEHMLGFERVLARLAGARPSAGLADSFRQWRHYEKADKVALAKVLDLVKKSGCVVCPTLVVFEGIAAMADPDRAKDPLQAYLPGSLKAFWEFGRYSEFAQHVKTAIPTRLALVADLYRAGVPLLCGTDLANPNVVAGFSLHREMVLFQTAGMPAAAVLRSATIVPARFLGVDRRLGAVAEGRTASLILTRKNPLEDVRNAAEIEGVFLRGRYFDRKALDAMLSDVRASVGGSATTTAAKAESAASRGSPAMPGRVVAEGMYELSFGRFPAGTETFKVTEDDVGLHFWSVHDPKGGMDVPSVTRVDVGRDLSFGSATWRQEAKLPVVASYVVEGSSLRATARKGGEDLPAKVLELPPGTIVIPPGTIGEFWVLPSLKLDPGATKSSKVVGFGFPDWKPALVATTFERFQDATLDLPGRPAIPVSHYRTTYESPIGAIVVESWLGADRVPVKSITKTPFGAIGAVLKQ